MIYNTYVLFLALFACIVYGKDINAIVKFGGKIYAFDGYPSLDTPPDDFKQSAFEVIGGIQTNSFTLTLPNTSAVVESSAVIGNTLYQFSGAYGSAYLSKYSLPLSSSPTLPSSQLELANQIQGIPAVFNQKDNIALVLVSRYLTLINLTTLTSQSNILAVSGSGKFPSCIVYNQKNNKVYYFQTNYCFAGYCQHIYEFKVNQNTGQLSYLDETFSPNFTSSFNDGELSGCGLDLNDNIIWCLHAKSERLYKFPISNINGYTSFKLPPGPYTNGNIAFNFNANKAYLTINKLNSLLREINLNNGVQSKSGSFRSGPDVASLNVVDGGQTLLVGFKFKGTRRMASINLNTFDDKYTNLHP